MTPITFMAYFPLNSPTRLKVLRSSLRDSMPRLDYIVYSLNSISLRLNSIAWARFLTQVN